MKMPVFNGNTKVALSIAGMLTLLGAVFAAGMSWSKVEAHAENTTIHESPEKKQQRIDDRIKLHLRPIDVRLESMDRKIDRIDTNLREFTNRGRI